MDSVEISHIVCCHLECDKNAEWSIFDEGLPVDNDTHACTEHVGELLSGDRHYVVAIDVQGKG